MSAPAIRSTIAVLSVVAALATGCGGSTPAGAPGSIAAAVDCSRSVRGEQDAWDHALSVIASEVLPRDETLLVGCFAGMRTGVQWLPAFEGNTLGRMTGGEAARRAAQAQWGHSLASLFERRLGVRDVAGTDWLSALEATSEVPHLRAVYLFSDLVEQAEGVDLTRELTTARLDAIARHWAPRLARLRGMSVVEIGGGAKLGGLRPDMQGVTLFRKLERLVGFHAEMLATLA
jgi:hypothetical protein